MIFTQLTLMFCGLRYWMPQRPKEYDDYALTIAKKNSRANWRAAKNSMNNRFICESVIDVLIKSD